MGKSILKMNLTKDFVHLHNHSTMSFGDGISQIKHMVTRAKEMGMHSLALTDHGYGHGLLEFHRECTKQGIKPILGCEIYLCYPGVEHTNRTEENRNANHLILLARNAVGYHNLIKILSFAATDGYYYKPKADYTLLAKYSEGLICLTACLAGPVAINLYEGDLGKTTVNIAKATSVLDTLKSIFGKYLYLEIQFHKMKVPTGRVYDLQSQLITNAVPLSKSTGVPLICTNDAHYVLPEQWPQRNVVIADGWVHLSNNGSFSGSGNPSSFLLLLTTSSCTGVSSSGCTHHDGAMDIHNNATGVIFYAANGMINLHNGVNVTEATAYKLRLDNTATITYNQGLPNASFSSGPSAGWVISDWKEIQ